MVAAEQKFNEAIGRSGATQGLTCCKLLTQISMLPWHSLSPSISYAASQTGNTLLPSSNSSINK